LFKADLSGGGEPPPDDCVCRGHVNAAFDTETRTRTLAHGYFARPITSRSRIV
jgi:hypothetical protein